MRGENFHSGMENEILENVLAYASPNGKFAVSQTCSLHLSLLVLAALLKSGSKDWVDGVKR